MNSQTSPPQNGELAPEMSGIRVPSFTADVRKPLELLRHCPAYQPTRCHRIEFEGTDSLLLKDESTRMGLGSFKALGGVYAVAALISDRWKDIHGVSLSPEEFGDPNVRSFSDSLTFTCASAGNHGLAVAAGTAIFGSHARIFLSETVPQEFADRLSEKGAQVIRAGRTYEESVEAASEDSRARGSLLLADSSWEDYWRAPSLVMEGYTVLAQELYDEFRSTEQWPSHVFLQAGVGGLASAITHMIRTSWTVQPQIIIVEPDAAPCLRESAATASPVTVSGPVSNMGRLDCKVPSLLALKVLLNSDVKFVAISDAQAEVACSELMTLNFGSTPSGAAGFAGLRQAINSTEIDEPCRPLVIVTEGGLS